MQNSTDFPFLSEYAKRLRLPPQQRLSFHLRGWMRGPFAVARTTQRKNKSGREYGAILEIIREHGRKHETFIVKDLVPTLTHTQATYNCANLATRGELKVVGTREIRGPSGRKIIARLFQLNPDYRN